MPVSAVYGSTDSLGPASRIFQRWGGYPSRSYTEGLFEKDIKKRPPTWGLSIFSYAYPLNYLLV